MKKNERAGPACPGDPAEKVAVDPAEKAAEKTGPVARPEGANCDCKTAGKVAGEGAGQDCEKGSGEGGQTPSGEPSGGSGEEEKLRAELAQAREQYLRANADFENIKRRLEKEKANAVLYANERLAADLLDVIDALEAALGVEASDEVSAKIKEGVANTLELFVKKLDKHGIRVIAEQGHFDPNIHEAMFHTQSQTHQSGQITQVLQKGYRIGERVLRHSKVSVAK